MPPVVSGHARCRTSGQLIKHLNMLHYTIVLFVVAIIAAVLGFGAIAGTAALIAKICFVVFLVLAVVSLLSGRRPSSRP